MHNGVPPYALTDASANLETHISTLRQRYEACYEMHDQDHTELHYFTLFGGRIKKNVPFDSVSGLHIHLPHGYAVDATPYESYPKAYIYPLPWRIESCYEMHDQTKLYHIAGRYGDEIKNDMPLYPRLFIQVPPDQGADDKAAHHSPRLLQGGDGRMLCMRCKCQHRKILQV